MNSAIGIDPGTKATGVAIIMPNGRIVLILARAQGRLAADRFCGMAAAIRDAIPLAHFALAQPGMALDPVVAIEWQHIRKTERNPNSMMGVQGVSGMALCACVEKRIRPENIRLPLPYQWKGSIPKEVHHKRILREAGLSPCSEELSGIPKSMRHNVIDALGLALWARKQKHG